jgi:hypothetical protein
VRQWQRSNTFVSSIYTGPIRTDIQKTATVTLCAESADACDRTRQVKLGGVGSDSSAEVEAGTYSPPPRHQCTSLIVQNELFAMMDFLSST